MRIGIVTEPSVATGPGTTLPATAIFMVIMPPP